MTGRLPPLPPAGEGRGEGQATRASLDITRARALRHQATPAEVVLWVKLRDRSLANAKFRRQVPAGPYILDFAAKSHRLIIEVDGETHAVGDRPARDARRDTWLKGKGWRVLRFTNREVLGNLDGVLQVLMMALVAGPHPDPLPQVGEGEG